MKIFVTVFILCCILDLTFGQIDPVDRGQYKQCPPALPGDTSTTCETRTKFTCQRFKILDDNSQEQEIEIDAEIRYTCNRAYGKPFCDCVSGLCEKDTNDVVPRDVEVGRCEYVVDAYNIVNGQRVGDSSHQETLNSGQILRCLSPEEYCRNTCQELKGRGDSCTTLGHSELQDNDLPDPACYTGKIEDCQCIHDFAQCV